jgi:predicted Rdx family selenoprotein
LLPGGRGEFTIWVDGVRVFDKAEHGGFPSDEQAVAAVAAGTAT